MQDVGRQKAGLQSVVGNKRVINYGARPLLNSESTAHPILAHLFPIIHQRQRLEFSMRGKTKPRRLSAPLFGLHASSSHLAPRKP